VDDMGPSANCLLPPAASTSALAAEPMLLHVTQVDRMTLWMNILTHSGCTDSSVRDSDRAASRYFGNVARIFSATFKVNRPSSASGAGLAETM
jgi:hypothetical protein